MEPLSPIHRQSPATFVGRLQLRLSLEEERFNRKLLLEQERVEDLDEDGAVHIDDEEYCEDDKIIKDEAAAAGQKFHIETPLEFIFNIQPHPPLWSKVDSVSICLR